MADNILDNIENKIMADLPNLAAGADMDPYQKFTLLITAARSSNNEALVKQAYDAAAAIKDPQEKSDAYAELLAEIDYRKAEKAGQLGGNPAPAPASSKTPAMKAVQTREPRQARQTAQDEKKSTSVSKRRATRRRRSRPSKGSPRPNQDFDAKFND